MQQQKEGGGQRHRNGSQSISPLMSVARRSISQAVPMGTIHQRHIIHSRMKNSTRQAVIT